MDLKVEYVGYIELANRLVNENSINKTLIKQMYDGIVVFDEVQKCYSRSHEALQYKTVLFLALLLRNRVTFVYLSATPLTYAEEIHDFLALMQVNSLYSDTQDELPKIMSKLQNLEQSIQASNREEFIEKAILLLL
jgi:hypothetical protein